MQFTLAGKKMYSKILLFGEYSLMYGSGALTRPYEGYHAGLCFPSPSMPPRQRKTAGNSNQLIRDYTLHLGRDKQFEGLAELLDLERLTRDTEEGLFLHSTIPSGYGLGSSGALVAAIYEGYARVPAPDTDTSHDLVRLRQVLAQMEGFFHGSSSGVDPLGILLNRPLLIGAEHKLSLPTIPGRSQDGKTGFFLINTRIPRKTSEQIAIFKNKMSDPSYRDTFTGEYIRGSDACLASCLAGGSDLHQRMGQLSLLQFEIFREMIPRNFLQVWQEGLRTGKYFLKLCGAGGGGFLLGHTGDMRDAEALLSRQHVGIKALDG